MAKSWNYSQPLVQRGIVLYIVENYEEAVKQLRQDINILESSKVFKASDLRLWLSACYNKLGMADEALKALDLDNSESHLVYEERYLLNNTLYFYAGQRELSSIMDITEREGKQDFSGKKKRFLMFVLS